MAIKITHSGWNRVASGLDVELRHGVPVRVSSCLPEVPVSVHTVTAQIYKLTGLNVSVHNWISLSPEEEAWSVCVDEREFSEVLRRLALSSAAVYVDRYHKPVEQSAVDWNITAFNMDFSLALEHCCLSHGTVNKDDFFTAYVRVMQKESCRLIDEGISPYIEAECTERY